MFSRIPNERNMYYVNQAPLLRLLCKRSILNGNILYGQSINFHIYIHPKPEVTTKKAATGNGRIPTCSADNRTILIRALFDTFIPIIFGAKSVEHIYNIMLK